MSSKCKKISDLDYSHSVIIDKLVGDRQAIENHRNQLKQLYKNETDEQIERRITNIVMRDNAFGKIMAEVIVKSFEFEIDPKEVEAAEKRIKENFKNIPENAVHVVAEQAIKRDLVFDELAKLWDMKVSDDEVKNSLNTYYKLSNSPINQILENKEQFEYTRRMIRDQKITQEILTRFPVKFDLKKPE